MLTLMIIVVLKQTKEKTEVEAFKNDMWSYKLDHQGIGLLEAEKYTCATKAEWYSKESKEKKKLEFLTREGGN